MASHLSGRTTVVTGAVGGLGFALTIGILQEGSDVVCLDLPAQPPEELWIAITAWAAKSNTIATYHHCDVTNEEEIKVVLEKAQRTAQERNHPIRGLVAGAGIQKIRCDGISRRGIPKGPGYQRYGEFLDSQARGENYERHEFRRKHYTRRLDSGICCEQGLSNS